MKRISFPAIPFFLFLVNIAHSQKYDNLWIHTYPGQDTANPLAPPYPATYLSFNTSPPTATYVSSLFFDDLTKTTISSRDGVPLFHSNGYSIFHLDGTVMNNGGGLSQVTFPASYPFGPPMPMTMMSLPRPEHEDDYYILYLEGGPDWYERRRLMLNLVIGATGPQTGSVAYKNKLLFADGEWLEFFQATKHANGRDWWVVMSDADSVTHERTFYSFFLGADTAYLANTQLIDGYEPVPPVWQNWTWQRTFTPDGKYLVTLDIINGVRIHSFDRCAGLLGPLLTLPYQRSGLGGVAVSQNSRFLYVATSYEMFQYDLTADDIIATIDTIAVYDGFIDTFLGGMIPTVFGLLYLGPDGKIYNMTWGDRSINYISKPNKKGAACEVVQHGFAMPTFASGPPYYPNYRLGPLDGSPCDTLGLNNEPLADFWWFTDSTLTVEFSDNSSYEPSEWHWNFGDGGSTSQDTSPVHTFPAAGTYQVCLTVSNQYAADTVCKQVTVGVSKAHEVAALPQVQVFPNPFSDEFVVRLNSAWVESRRFLLLDALGRVVRDIPMEDIDTKVSLPYLPSGIYYCQIWSNNNFLQTGKLVKMQK